MKNDQSPTKPIGFRVGTIGALFSMLPALAFAGYATSLTQVNAATDDEFCVTAVYRSDSSIASKEGFCADDAAPVTAPDGSVVPEDETPAEEPPVDGTPVEEPPAENTTPTEEATPPTAEPQPTPEPEPEPALMAPASVSFKKYLGSEVQLDWTPVEGATGYRIESTGTSTVYGSARIQTVSQVNTSVTVQDGAATTATIRLPGGTEGNVTVKALNGTEESVASEQIPVTTPVDTLIAKTPENGGTSFDFTKAAQAGATGSTADLVSTPRGSSLASANGRYFAVFQADNNFVIYDNDTKRSTYTANTHQVATDRLTYQTDANLVAYNSAGTALKATGTHAITKPANLVMQDDGNLVIYNASGTPKWAASSLTFMKKAY